MSELDIKSLHHTGTAKSPISESAEYVLSIVLPAFNQLLEKIPDVVSMQQALAQLAEKKADAEEVRTFLSLLEKSVAAAEARSTQTAAQVFAATESKATRAELIEIQRWVERELAEKADISDVNSALAVFEPQFNMHSLHDLCVAINAASAKVDVCFHALRALAAKLDTNASDVDGLQDDYGAAVNTAMAPFGEIG